MSKTAIVFGAGGAVGEAIVHALIDDGWHVTASLRRPRDDVAARLAKRGALVRRDDLEALGDWAAAAAACDAIVFTTQLGLANSALAHIPFANQRVIAFSSNNVAVQPEAASYVKLAAGEGSLSARHPDAAIIRPTLIYGDPRLPTVSRLMRMARVSPLVPMPGTGLALLQPVFHEDLARAVAWLAADSGPGTYAIGGPDFITMHDLYRAIVRASGAKAEVVPIPVSLLRLGAPFLRWLNLYSREQILRADRDRLVVECTPLPAEIVAKVGLGEGLQRLALALH